MERIQTDGSLALQEKNTRVITIPALERQKEPVLRVAAYTRVSTESEDQLNSFAAQSSYYLTLIASKDNWRLVDIYADKGITGTLADKRPDFQRLMEDCRRGVIDRILVKSISRFARNTKECLKAIRELKTLGVSVNFEKERIDTAVMTGEMLAAVFATFAQAESQTNSSNMRWSYQRRMQSGTFIPSHQPFGYKLVDKQITVDVPKARFVCEIFAAYLAGWNTREIADYLNRLQPDYPELCGRTWTVMAISRILKNEKYTGDSIWQKSYRTSSFPPKESKNRGEVQKYFAEYTHPPIIDREVFRITQDLFSKRNACRKSPISDLDRPFRKKVVCGHCGCYLREKTINGRVYRSCRIHEADQAKCGQKPIPEQELKKAFLRLYFNLKHSGLPVLKKTGARLRKLRERRLLWSMDVIELNKRISFLSCQNQLLAKLKQQGVIDPDIFISRSNELAEQLQSAKLDKERLLAAESDNSIDLTEDLIETIEAGPDFLEDFSAELFGELVEGIIVECSEQVRFRLKNGLELRETIERTGR